MAKKLNKLRMMVPSGAKADGEKIYSPEEVKLDINSTTHGVLNADRVDIEVGGRNLILGSSEPIVLPPRDTGSGFDNYNYLRIKAPMIKDETYTLSFNVEITDGYFDKVSIFPQFEHTEVPDVNLVNGRGVYTFKAVADTDNIYIYAGLAGATRGNGLILHEYQLEKGNIATDWTPAPEDVPLALTVPTAGVPFLVGHGGTASSFGKLPTHGSTYDLEIGEKGLRVDGPIIDTNGGEVSSRWLDSPDTRDVSPRPDDFGRGVSYDFKRRSSVGNPGSGNYVGVQTWKSYGGRGDQSGGPVLQIAYDNNGDLYTRISTGLATWANWVNLMTPGWANVTGKPSTFPPSGHTHTKNQITDLTMHRGNLPNGNAASKDYWSARSTGTYWCPNSAGVTNKPSDYGLVTVTNTSTSGGASQEGYATWHAQWGGPLYIISWNSVSISSWRQVAQMNNFADYVVEQGSNYTKWNSGKLEQWGKTNFTIGTTQSVGAIYRSPSVQRVNFPVPFVGVPTLDTSTSGSGAFGFAQNDVTNAWFDGRLIHFYSQTVTTPVSWHAYGRWK